MNKWDELSLLDKNNLMKTYIGKGIKDLSSIKNHYNSFSDGGDSKVPSYLGHIEIILGNNKEESLPKNTNPNTSILIKNGSSNKPPYRNLNSAVTEEMANYIWEAENENKTGYKEGKWFPYVDKADTKNKTERGNLVKTIGPGFRLNSTMSNTISNSEKGLTTDELNIHLINHMREQELQNIKGYESLYGKDSYMNIPFEQQALLLDLGHQTGSITRGWPSLLGSINKGDKKQISEEYLLLKTPSKGTTRRNNLRYNNFINNPYL